MAVYSYSCSHCEQTTDRDAPLGEAPRTVRCKCGHVARQRLGVGLGIAAAALPNKGAAVVAIDRKEQRWGEDMPAYKRMRQAGLQPPQIDGSAQLEDRAGSQFDIDYAKALDVTDSRQKVIEIVESVKPLATPRDAA